ncbi:MAG: DUF1592 domain-containing protein [Gemmatimonadetes bacterium]|nr:DUF1592 domain-containing protein [Gemmatimonadota bacterium]
MRTLVAGGFLLGAWLTLGASPHGVVTPETAAQPARDAVVASAPGGGASDASAEELREVIEQYCVRCHSDARLRGNLSLEDFDPARAHEMAPTAEKMIVKLRAGMMPPPGVRRPEGDTLTALAETLESVIDEAAAADPDPGIRRFQRLNRAEYERVINDLLDLEIDAGRWLPADTYLGNFDNLSAAQGLSTTLLEAYLRAATEVSRLAVGNPAALPVSVKYTSPIDVSQHAWDRLEGTPIGTRGGMVVTHDFPADGEYVFSVATLFGQGVTGQDLDVSIDGEGVGLIRIPHNGSNRVPLQTGPVFVTAGQHQVAAAFVRTIDGPYEDRLSPFDWSFVGGEDAQQWANYGITALPHLADLMITGPHDPVGVSESASRARIFTCRPASPSEERPCAESIVRRLATQAYRRPVTDADLLGPMRFYDEGAAEGGFEIGVRTALQSILANPQFLFRLEEQPEGVAPGESYRLSAVDLASRLSFFLWGTVPDAELLAAAESGSLTDVDVLEEQVERMLLDPRAEALATRFASQWLRLQDAVKNQPEPFLYPDFNGQLRDDMVRETQLFFQHLVREDRSLLELYDADYTFLNQRLARHYGIAGVVGDEFRRVEYPDDTRRGILGHGSVLLLTSMSQRTSPVLRGKWVMEVLMGAPPPPPPPNVPNFEETATASEGRRLTTRERMEIHRANPTCNACHRLMDPIGLALDNFDVTGQWRIREQGMPLDTRGTYYDGTPIGVPADLTEVLLDRPIPLVRNFTANMLAYAMGRRVEYFDQPSIRDIAEAARGADYRMSSFIMGVVNSDPFQMMRAQDTDETLDHDLEPDPTE